MQRRLRAPVVLTAVTAVVAGATAVPATSNTDSATAMLTMHASLALTSKLGGCAPPTGATDCAVRTIRGPFAGLGQVTGQYEFYLHLGAPTCADGEGKALAYPIRLTVAGKGDIEVVAAEPPCVLVDLVRTQTQTFTVTGGTGTYAGASGSGTLERSLGGETASGRLGHELWTGTLSVPGLEFDVTPPELSGAVAKTVRARGGAGRASVRYSVTARDGVDGRLPVACRPRSGSKFKIGRTVVTCSATDSSANTQTARFTITVRARR